MKLVFNYPISLYFIVQKKKMKCVMRFYSQSDVSFFFKPMCLLLSFVGSNINLFDHVAIETVPGTCGTLGQLLEC